MRTTFLRIFPLLLIGALAACEQDAQQASQEPEGEAIARVNGEPVTENELLHYAMRRTGGDPSMLDGQVMQQLTDELVNIELLAQAAREQKLDEQSPLREQIAFQIDTLMADAAMMQRLEQQPVTDEEVRAEYEERKGELARTEFKARHILVEEEAAARDLIRQLEEGADFQELAKQNSIEPGADRSGGDLGWFSPSQMVPPFANAVSAMQPGERSADPVQTQFGWHVIQLEDKREAPAPEFEQIEEQIRRGLMNERIQDYINELRGKAEITRPGAEAQTEEQAAPEQPAEQAGQSPGA